MSNLISWHELALCLPSANRYNLATEEYSHFIEAALNRMLLQDLAGETNKEAYEAGYFSLAFYDELITDLNSEFQTGAEAATLYDNTVTYSDGDFVWKTDNKLYKYQNADFSHVQKFTSVPNCELWHVGGLAKIIGWMIWTVATPHVTYNQGNTGITKAKGEHIESASSKDVALLNNAQTGIVDDLRQSLHRYLIKNKDDFSTYSTDHDNKKVNTKTSRRFAGFAAHLD